MRAGPIAMRYHRRAYATYTASRRRTGTKGGSRGYNTLGRRTHGAETPRTHGITTHPAADAAASSGHGLVTPRATTGGCRTAFGARRRKYCHKATGPTSTGAGVPPT